MEVVKRGIISQYGAPAMADAPSMYYGLLNSFNAKSSEGHNSLWVSDATMGDYMNDSNMDVFILTTKASLSQGENWYEMKKI